MNLSLTGEALTHQDLAQAQATAQLSCILGFCYTAGNLTHLIYPVKTWL